MKWPSGKTLLLCAIFLLLLAVIEIWLFYRSQNGKYIKIVRVHLFIFMGLVNIVSIRYIWRRFNTIIKTNSIIAVGFIFKVVVLVTMTLSMIALMFVLLPASTNPHILSYISSVCLGAVVFLSTCLFISDTLSCLIRRILSLFRHSSRPPTVDKTEMKIRSFLALFCALFLVFYGTFGVRKITVQHVSVPIRNLDNRLNGTIVVQLSDIHLGPFTGKKVMENIVELVNPLRPDIVAITGDLVDCSFESLKEAVSPLKDIQSKHGVYFVTGNHEYYTGDVDTWIKSLPQFNVTPLVNERLCLFGSHDPDSRSCDRGLYLAGLEDIETRKKRYGPHSMDLRAALSGRSEGVPTIVLAHQPWAAVEVIMWDDVQLVLSGHTHGGQFFPMAPLVYFYNPFFCGLYEPRPDVFVYVNPGSFYYVLPFRHYYQPEITAFTLITS